ncbi:MAG: LysR family transcriptional regulator [Polynucleobacter sp.]|nr:LysR family transcriptional regulator [Polynucleobacter sp.]
MNQLGISKINISLLQTFHLVAKHGSYSAASRTLNISYQTAANHVRRLEQLYGAPLIKTDRGSRKVILTAKGKALHASLSGELDNILSRISLLLENQRSVLRVGVPQALFHYFFPDVLKAFKREAPSMELAFFERDTTLEKMMLDGVLDAAVSERFFGQDAIVQHLIGEYHLSLVYPRHWFGADEQPVSLTAFAERDMISFEVGQTIRVRAVDYLSEHFGQPPRITVTTSGSTSIMLLIGVGLGYSVVPQWMTTPDDPKIAQIVLKEIQPISVYFSHTALLSSNEFVHQLHQTCSEVMGGKLNTFSPASYSK